MKKISIITYAIVFSLFTIGLGFFSVENLVDFYVNDRVNYNEWTVDLGSKFETDIATTFAKKFQFVNINGAVRNLIGQREMNSVVKLNNGHLIEPQPQLSDAEIKRLANGIIEYADFCKAQGKPFLFVQPIFKVDKENKQLPAGIEDFSNEIADAILGYIREAGVEVLDIRECMKADGLDMYDYTYVTDHHWTSIGAFYAFTKIADWIGKNTGIYADPEVVDINNYDIVTYPKWHLGSSGQRTGQYFAGIDDYDLILPAFDAAFVDNDGNSHSFYEQVVNEGVLRKRNPENRYTYDRALRWPDGVATTSKELSLLFITDSYSKGMIPYLKLAYSDYCEEYYPFGFCADYVFRTDPDVVVLMPYMINEFSPGAVYHAS